MRNTHDKTQEKDTETHRRRTHEKEHTGGAHKTRTQEQHTTEAHK